MKKDEVCEVYCFDEKLVNETKDKLNKEDIKSAALMFKVLADLNRAKIAFALEKAKELCVCDLANILDITIPNTSHHLRKMLALGVVKYRKEGKLAFYSLEDEYVGNILVDTLKHLSEVVNNE